MDETTTIETTTEQQQFAELQAKVEGLRVAIPAEQGIDVAAPSPQVPVADSVAPIDLEKTPEFEVWKAAKINESLNYLRDNWGMDITAEKLILHDDYLGFPDSKNRRAYAVVWSYNYIDSATGVVAINPATKRRMVYRVWRKIDPPAASVSAEPTDIVGQ